MNEEKKNTELIFFAKKKKYKKKPFNDFHLEHNSDFTFVHSL